MHFSGRLSAFDKMMMTVIMRIWRKDHLIPYGSLIRVIREANVRPLSEHILHCIAYLKRKPYSVKIFLE